jgi:GT2 family glycosyltransferase
MANTAALMMIKKKIFDEVGGFDEALAVDYNDVDLSLSIVEKGYMNVWIPFVEAYHYEQVSRGDNRTPKKLNRFEKERKIFLQNHKEITQQADFYYTLH